MSFDSLGLAPELLRAVAEEGYTQPTPIQQQGIPAVLSGRDLLAAAQTGTGKTAAFTLPILQKLGGSAPAPLPRVLVLVPTRELAAQVAESVRTYGKHLQLRTAVIFGGVGFTPQADILRRGVDIIVATPGRLLDHAQQRTVNLSGIEILVLDEADRMLDMGFIHDIKRVLKLLPPKKQNLMFSATFNPDIRKLAEGLLHDPLSVEVAPRNTTAERIEQRVFWVDKNRKSALLSLLVREGDWKQVLVFTRTKHGANRLAEQLARDGIQTAAIHGNKSQNARTRALADFKAGQVRVLVATDIAARGLDIEQLPHVVNYELPNVPEDYVHRIGRTGRAGMGGEAISLVCGEEKGELRDIQRLLKKEIPAMSVPGFEPGSPLTEPERARQQQQPAQRPQQQAPRQNHGRRGGGQRSQPQHQSRPPQQQRQPSRPPQHTPAQMPHAADRPEPGNEWRPEPEPVEIDGNSIDHVPSPPKREPGHRHHRGGQGHRGGGQHQHYGRGHGGGQRSGGQGRGNRTGNR
jgi:ATP-dependent RNA helicase RhlE